jgi:hypothetical protein
MRYLIRLIDNSKFIFVSDLGEIGHYEITSRSTIFKDRDQDAIVPGRSDKR